MSSILDALERASQDRPSGESDLIPKGYVEEPESGFRLLWLLLGALGLVLLLFSGYWLYGVMPDSLETKARSNGVVELPAGSAEDRPESIERGAEPVSTPSLSVDLQSRLRDSGMPSQRSLLSEAALSSPATVRQAAPEERASVSSAEQEVPPAVEREVEMPPPQPDSEVVSRTEVAVLTGKSSPASIEQPALKPAPTSSTSSPEERPASQIPLIWELPQQLRQELEQLKISIHVYNQEPERRFVIINMRRYAEGDSLTADGYRLERIDRDGIVVDYGDGLVRLLREKYY